MKSKALCLVSGMLWLVALLMTGCQQQEAEPLPVESGIDMLGNVVSASGKVMPQQWATMSFEVGGRLEWVAAEGSQVAAGDVVARLETSDLDHAVAQARAARETAEAQLAQAKAEARPANLAAADGAILVAQGNLAAATGALAQAELLAGPRDEEIAMYQARLDQAHADYRYVEDIHLEIIDNHIGGRPEERARFQSESALGARNAAQAQLDLARAGASPGEIAAARAMVSGAAAQVTIAEAGLTAAEVALNQAQAMRQDLTIAESQVQIAQGQLDQAEAQRDRLVNGATTEELAVLEAQLAQTEAALAQAEEAVGKATLLAPFAGTVGDLTIQAGETVLPGAAILVLGDVGHFQVETTDLNEVDAIQVAAGMPVTLSFDAFPGGTTAGEIVRLAPMASAGQGGTNFTAIVEMVSPPDGLQWGMTAFVDIEVE
jgi:HlyD family secretion protein